MARWNDLSEAEQNYQKGLRLLEFDDAPYVAPKPMNKRRIALLTTAGIERRSTKPYPFFSGEFRMIPADAEPGELVMSHLSPNFDRSGFQQDINVVFPIDRLRELAAQGEIGSVARYHYSFMGGSDPEAMEPFVPELAQLLRDDDVDTVVLCPV
jgi:D-proline reductase (dithiol) PrdB